MSSVHQRAPRTAFLVICAVVVLSCFRLTHVHLLWADEDYHLAAAIDLLHGKVMYRDFWYDKPPLSAIYYLLIGGHAGWLLRLFDAAYISASCLVIYRFANSWWGRREGFVAALLLAVFTTFYLPSAVIPFAADAIILLPHLLAVYLAHLRKPILAGLFAGIAFLANTKAVFVVASCCLFLNWDILWLLSGFLLAAGSGLLALLATGGWAGYVEQVWRWGFAYTKGSPVTHPLVNGTVRTLNWLGFHSLLGLGTGLCLRWESRRTGFKLAGWIFLSFWGVAMGSRFAPHYFLQVLPALVLASSRGLVLAFERSRRRTLFAVALCLVVPVIRFAPRYVSLAFDELNGRSPKWADVAMDLDSQEIAAKINATAKPEDTLFVWGYRPDVYVYTRLVSDSRFWDSQPLTGVPADRHLSATSAIYARPAVANRLELSKSHPTWIVDGLGLLNPKLRLQSYPDLAAFLAEYRLVGRTKLSLLYHRRN